MKNIFNVYLSYSGFRFLVANNKKHAEVCVHDFDNKELIILTSVIGKGKNLRHSVHCWYGEKGKTKIDGTMVDTELPLLYDSGNEEKGSLPWEKGIWYSYQFDFKTNTMQVARLLTNKEGKKILSKTPHRCSNKIDTFIDNFDLQCACGEWMSNPCDGRVKYLGSLKNYKPSDDTFIYNNKVYQKLDWKKWHIKTFYNASEFDKDKVNWAGREDKDFDKVWEEFYKETTADTIIKPNLPTAGWRGPDNKVVYFKRTPVIGSYERVLSYGYMTTPSPDTVDCPCCDILHRVYSETTSYYPLFGKLKLKVYRTKLYQKILSKIEQKSTLKELGIKK